MLSRKVQEILDLIIPGGRTAKRSLPAGMKLVVGGGAHLEPDTVRFVKSLTEPAKSDLVKSHLAARRMAAPTVAPAGSPRTTAGISDADIKVLEQQVTDEQLTPVKATVRFAETYDVISRNMGRRMSATE
jgi:hypothetical protein